MKYLVLSGILTLFVLTDVFASSNILKGNVVDQNGIPIPGATVIASKDGDIIRGTAADHNGNFKINFQTGHYDTIEVKATSIGYNQEINSFAIQSDTTFILIILEEKPLEIGTVVVSPEVYRMSQEVSTGHHEIILASNHSLIASDPINAIRQPQVIRVGSNHSSKIRINGTSPKYYINGANIGSDPNHYGLFSIIPASMVNNIKLYSQGTGASYGLPSAIEISTNKPYAEKLSGDINLSVVEGTGTISMGKERYFIISSARKSFLDRIVNQLDYQTDRQSLPPVNFMDIFVSGGLKLTPNHSLFVDQYFIEDFLSYQTAPSLKNPGGVEASQKTNEKFVGVRFEAVDKNAVLKIGGALKNSRERYFARPASGTQPSGFAVDLTAEHFSHQANIEASLIFENSRLTLGDNLDHTASRDIKLYQTNWNFHPPDYISDNPYIFQEAMNALYGSYEARDSELYNAAFLSVEHIWGRFEIVAGIRSEYFNRLAESQKLLYRNSFIYHINQKNKLELFHGTFAENPVNRISEAYQVLIHDCLPVLKPISTNLTSLNYINEFFNLGVFSKRIKDIPALIPDFNYLASDGSFERGFLIMRSAEQIAITGGDIKFEFHDFISPNLNMYSYYSYTHADDICSDLTRPYSLNASHRFFIQADYKLSSSIGIAAEFSARSGYSYTPPVTADDTGDLNRYTYDYYIENLRRENSLTFPPNATLNLHADFNLGKFQIYFNVLNVTNHSNPIISAADGFIYDSGILPSIGINYKP